MLDAGPRTDTGGTAGSAASRELSNTASLLGAALLAAAALLAVIALWPAYYVGIYSLVDKSDLIVATAITAAGWLAAAGLVASRRPALVEAGAFAAAGLSITDLGLRLADLGQLSNLQGGRGLWLFSVAWVVAAAGSASACVAVFTRGERVLRPWTAPSPTQAGLMAATVAAAGLLAVAFVFAWDRYIITTVADPTVRLSTVQGYAFSGPGLLIAGNVLVAVALGLIPVAAVLLRPVRAGAYLLAGALVVALAQVVSAVVQTLETADPNQALGALPVGAQQQIVPLGPVVSLHLTGWFDAEMAAVLALLVLGALWAARDDHVASPASALPATAGWGTPGGWGAAGWSAYPGDGYPGGERPAWRDPGLPPGHEGTTQAAWTPAPQEAIPPPPAPPPPDDTAQWAPPTRQPAGGGPAQAPEPQASWPAAASDAETTRQPAPMPSPVPGPMPPPVPGQTPPPSATSTAWAGVPGAGPEWPPPPPQPAPPETTPDEQGPRP